MPIADSWHILSRQNSFLKSVVMCLTGINLILAAALISNTNPPSFVIERGCFTKVITSMSNERTKIEIEQFIREALVQRFNSDSLEANYLAEKEQAMKTAEQKAMVERQMRQTIVIHDVTMLEDNRIKAEADRLLRVGPLRSALLFPLILTVTLVERSKDNPYGLLLTEIDEIKPMHKDKT